MLIRTAEKHGIRTHAGLTICLDRSIQLGVAGCGRLMDEHLPSFAANVAGGDGPHTVERERFEALYTHVKGRGWSHRLRKLIDTCDWSVTYDVEVR